MYKYLKEDNDVFHVQHPDGSTFKVAKKGLSDDFHKKIRNYADGGLVEDSSGRNPASEESENVADDEDASDDKSGKEKNIYANLKVSDFDIPKNTQDDNNSDSQAFDQALQKGKDYSHMMQFENPEALPPQMKDLGTVSPPAPVASTAPAPQGNPNELSKDYQNYFNQMGAANQGVANAQMQQSKGVVDALQNQQDQLAQQQRAFETNKKQYDDRSNALFQEIQNGKVDPNRYWNDKSTSGKVMGIIGLIMGGAGGQGHGNIAMDMLNRQIDRDIDSQKNDMGKKENLLNINLKRTGDLEQANLLTRSNILTGVQSKIAQVQAATQSPMAKAQLQQANAALDMQKMQIHKQMAMYQTQAQLQQGTTSKVNPMAINALGVADKLVNLPNGGQILANTKEDASDLKKTVPAVASVMNTLNKMQTFMNQNSGLSVLSPAAKAEGHALEEELQINKMKAQDLSPRLFKSLEDNLPKPGDLTSLKASNLAKMKVANEGIRDYLKNELKSRTQGNF